MKKTGTIVNSKRKIESERLGSKRERGWQNKSKNVDRDDKTGKIVNSKRKIERIKAGEGVAEQTIKAKLTSGVNISLFSC